MENSPSNAAPTPAAGPPGRVEEMLDALAGTAGALAIAVSWLDPRDRIEELKKDFDADYQAIIDAWPQPSADFVRLLDELIRCHTTLDRSSRDARKPARVALLAHDAAQQAEIERLKELFSMSEDRLVLSINKRLATQAENARLTAAKPPGWKLVPEEPTAKMIDTARQAWQDRIRHKAEHGFGHIDASLADNYRAMLKGSPQPPAQGLTHDAAQQAEIERLTGFLRKAELRNSEYETAAGWIARLKSQADASDLIVGWVCVGPGGEIVWSTVRATEKESRAYLGTGWRCVPLALATEPAQSVPMSLIHELAGERPSIEGEEPAWSVDVFELERRLRAKSPADGGK